MDKPRTSKKVMTVNFSDQAIEVAQNVAEVRAAEIMSAPNFSAAVNFIILDWAKKVCSPEMSQEKIAA